LQRVLANRFDTMQLSMIATIDAAAISDIEAWFDKAISASRPRRSIRLPLIGRPFANLRNY
jgi:hypothetical protein